MGDSGGPLTFFNGTQNILVGVSSFTWNEECEGIGLPDGFAKGNEISKVLAILYQHLVKTKVKKGISLHTQSI